MDNDGLRRVEMNKRNFALQIFFDLYFNKFNFLPEIHNIEKQLILH